MLPGRAIYVVPNKACFIVLCIFYDGKGGRVRLPAEQCSPETFAPLLGLAFRIC